MVLVTPSLTNLFDKDNGFVRRLLKTFLDGSGKNRREVDVLFAVVDQIPLPRQESLKKAGMNLKNVNGIRPIGMEGISFAVGRSSCMAPDLWSKECDVQPNKNEASDGMLSFDLKTKPISQAVMVSQDSNTNISCTYHLPLSKTIFRNGRPSTLFSQRWQINFDTDTTAKLICIQEKDSSHRQVRLFEDWGQSKFNGVVKSRYWHYLTPPRTVAEAVGNIVRRLEKNDGSKQLLTASEELGVAVSSLLASQQFPGKIEIWAQITPKENWSNQPKLWQDMGRFLISGDRFHKVLGGGGGWGEKKGLVALDPDSSFYHTNPDPDHFFDTPFSQVVRPGDLLRFIGLWYNELTNGYTFNGPVIEENPVTINSPRTFRFGSTFPLLGISDIDTDSQDKRILVAYNHFGALSDQGSSLSIDVRTQDGKKNIARHGFGTFVTTKMPPLFTLDW